MTRTVRFGVIGCGLMGREFASAAMRWPHLPDMDVRPEIVALCDSAPGPMQWFQQNIPSVSLTTQDYKEVLASDQVDAVYIALPHHLHEEVYTAAIRAGKHLLGEKPFGIDRAANDAIVACAADHPDVFVRCTSQMPFYPAVQRIGRMIDNGEFGQNIEVEAGFLHSSDMNTQKAINWKRIRQFNGDYGCMGDLGMHVCHVPFRAGWRPRNVRAVLSNIVRERPDGKGGMAPCETWDNATLFCEAVDSATGEPFPMTLKTFRIAPGEKNTWYLKVLGTKASARFSTKNPRRLDVLRYEGGEQAWEQIDMGCETAFKSITGGIFELGFSDVVLQMWAAFLWELHHNATPSRFAGCVTPAEVALSHQLFTAALKSQADQATVLVE